MGKTKMARFTAVVEASGRPQTMVLWQDPKKDPGFQSALQQDRIMTVLREPKGKEYGVAGFKRSKTATYLLFPRKLDSFEGKRIVGIKYEQLAPTSPVGKPLAKSQKTRGAAPEPAPVVPKQNRQYEVTLRITAVAEESFLVEAGGNAEAKRAALATLGEKLPDLGKAKITRHVSKIKKA
ncbi:MAG: hypothetical protein JWM16_3137 [Verrucomicrobiales bacterium]|nr:hypothetical protein [Verrucomicrobiales bacterium]